jgi:hypothetical protein
MEPRRQWLLFGDKVGYVQVTETFGNAYGYTNLSGSYFYALR